MDPTPRHFRSQTSKHALDHFLRGASPPARDRTHILILQLRASFFELAHRHQDSFEDVQRFETGNDNGYLEAGAQRLIFTEALYGANMAGAEERLDTVVGRFENCG